MNAKFHNNCENTGKILKISCVRYNFVKFATHFLGHSKEILRITQFPDGFRLNSIVGFRTAIC